MVTITIEYPDSDKKKAADEKNQTPAKLADGIVIERTVTDLFMCIIFALFFLGMFATAAYGYAKGNPLKLLTPYDSKGMQCGRKENGTQEFKYLFWPELDKAVNVKSVVELTDAVLGNSFCVKECPLFHLINIT